MVVGKAYTATYDASMKVRVADKGHMKQYLRHVFRKADYDAERANPERERWQHSSENIDQGRTYLNEDYLNVDGQLVEMSAAGLDSTDVLKAFEKRIGTVQSKRKMRSDAVGLRPLILQLDPEWFRDNVPDWKEKGLRENKDYQCYQKAQIEWAQKEFGVDNILAVSLHMDEASPQLHVLFTPITDDNRLSQTDFFKGKTSIKKQHKAYRKHLREVGYNATEEVSARSREHLSSAEFKRRAERVKYEAEEIEKEREELAQLKIELEEEKKKVVENSQRLDDERKNWLKSIESREKSVSEGEKRARKMEKEVLDLRFRVYRQREKVDQRELDLNEREGGLQRREEAVERKISSFEKREKKLNARKNKLDWGYHELEVEKRMIKSVGDRLEDKRLKYLTAEAQFKRRVEMMEKYFLKYMPGVVNDEKKKYWDWAMGKVEKKVNEEFDEQFKKQAGHKPSSNVYVPSVVKKSSESSEQKSNKQGENGDGQPNF